MKKDRNRQRDGGAERDRKRKLQWRVKTSPIPTTVSIAWKSFSAVPLYGKPRIYFFVAIVSPHSSRFATDHIVLSMESKEIYGIASFIFAVLSFCFREQGLNYVNILASTQSVLCQILRWLYASVHIYTRGYFCKTSAKSLKLFQMCDSLVSLKSGHKMRKKNEISAEKNSTEKRTNKHTHYTYSRKITWQVMPVSQSVIVKSIVYTMR